MDFTLYFKSRQAEMVKLLKELVSRESPTQDKKAVDACSSFLVEEFRKLGCQISRLAQKEVGDFYLIKYFNQLKNRNQKPLLILTHIDTVWPVGKLNQMPFYISGDRIYGPGVLDMKAGLVMAFEAIKALFDLNIIPRRPIFIFINSAEETGHKAAHELILKLARQSAYVLCLEPALPGGGLKTQRKGRMVIRMETKGRAAHAGTPEKGVNAINELILNLGKLKALQKGGITANIGLIGGGEKPNIVPDKAWAVVDFRFWTNSEKQKILTFLHSLKPSLEGAKIKYHLESLTPPLEKSPASREFFNRLQAIASGLRLKLSEGKTGGGSDASIAASTGVPTLDGLGPDGDGIHAKNEHLLLSSLIERTALLTEVMRQL
ncbi:MAG: M20 family metallopeptidase [Candidatus Aminicenantes bacterium]|nr:M20 family metallopeptidase [Candidatus Aminicenantes bacterium]